ncbi:MAG: LytTR family transcriptional regulator [Undibacterium sp.]|nr:LytTR family transcriptional regulator [Undibacterium sp.]
MSIDKVVYVELSTAASALDGLHHIELKSIKFHGKWISQAHLLMGVVTAWLVFGLTRLVLELLDFRANLVFTKRRVAHLMTVLRTKKSQIQTSPDAPSSIVKIESENQAPVEQLDNEEQDLEVSTQKKNRPNYLRWISATVGNSMRLIVIDDIIYFQADQKYTRVVLADSEVLIKKSLKELLDELDPDQFWRMHRSIVINILEIASITPNVGGELIVKLKSRREQLPVSEAFIRKFRQML